MPISSKDLNVHDSNQYKGSQIYLVLKDGGLENPSLLSPLEFVYILTRQICFNMFLYLFEYVLGMFFGSLRWG